MNTQSLKAFYRIFDIAFYLFVLVAATILVMEVMRWVNDDMSTTYSFNSIKPHLLEKPVPQKISLTPSDTQVKDPYLITSEWEISFQAASWQLRAYMSALAFIHVGFALLVLMILRAFVLSLKKNETFTLQNISRLRRIGFLLLLIEPFHWMMRYFVYTWSFNYFNLERVDKSVAHRAGYQLGYSLASGEIVWNWILAGLMVLIIAEVFKQGLKLKDEVDLTV